MRLNRSLTGPSHWAGATLMTTLALGTSTSARPPRLPGPTLPPRATRTPSPRVHPRP